MDTNAPFSTSRTALTDARSRGRVRTLLLGAVALSVLAGAGLNSAVSTVPALASTVQPQAAIAPTSFADVVEHVRGAVVSVKVSLADTSGEEARSVGPQGPQFAPGEPLERFFRRFGEEQPRNVPGPHAHGGQALGSGFVISSDGYVVTNNHVVENATDVKITVDDGRTVSAKIVGTDKKTDLALLKIVEPGTYQYVDFATASPRVGDWVIAVGNPFGLGGTVTAGIVSARGRDIGSGPYDDYLQIDAPVNRGNSGGPTFDAQGHVVGVNTAIFSPSGGSVGIGFAIPAEVARNVVASLKDKGSVARGWIGVQIQPVTADIAESLGLKTAKGALVSEAQANAPASQAGVKSGDVIIGVNGEAIEGPRDLARKIAGIGPEKKVDLTYWHDGSEKTATLTLGVLPNERMAKADAPAQADRDALGGLGLTLAPASSVPGAGRNGVVVADVDQDGIAAQKGLRSGDIILEAAGAPVSRPADIAAALDMARKAGHKAVLLRVRNGEGTRFVALAPKAAG